MTAPRLLVLLALATLGLVMLTQRAGAADYRAFLKKSQRHATPSKVWRDSQARQRAATTVGGVRARRAAAARAAAAPARPARKRSSVEVRSNGAPPTVSIEQARANVEAATTNIARSDALVALAHKVLEHESDAVAVCRLLDEAYLLDPTNANTEALGRGALLKLLDYALIHPYLGMNVTVLKEAVDRTGPETEFQFMDHHHMLQMGPKGEEVHMIVQVWQLYLRAVNHDSLTGQSTEVIVRQLMLNLLRAGLHADVLFNWGFQRNVNSIGGTPLGYLGNDRKDIELFEAFVDAGHLMTPSVYHTPQEALDERAGVPAEYYRTVLDRSSHGVSVIHLLTNGAASVLYMRDIYMAYNDHVLSGTPFFDALAKVKLDRFWRYSPTLSAIFHRIQDGEPLCDTNLTRKVLSDSDTEMEVAMMKMLFGRPDFLIEDHLLLTRPDNFSPMHMAVGMGRAASLTAILEHCRDQVQRFPARAVAIKSALRTALEAHTEYAGRAALHAAGLFHGQDHPVFKAVVALQEFAAGDLAKMHDLTDDFGRVPLDYDKRVSIATPYDEETQRALTEAASVKPPRERYVYEAADSGGWGVEPDPVGLGDLDVPDDRCDVLEFDGLPSADVMAVLMERNQPAVFRGAVRDWLMRDVWARVPFLEKFANRSVSVSAIPYHERFDQTRPNVTLEMLAPEYVASWGGDAERFETDEAPRYLFSASLAVKFDDIMDDAVDLVELLESFYYPTSQLGKQFYFGPRYTGAPMHFHNTAINALAYGKKKWFLTRPNETFYSIKATKQLWKDDVPNLEHNSSLQHCTQFAGDLMFVGGGWGHATLNTQHAIGFAMEWMDQRLSASISMPPLLKSDYEPRMYTHDKNGPYGDVEDMMQKAGVGMPLPPSEAGSTPVGIKCNALRECAVGLVCRDISDGHVLTVEQRCHGSCACAGWDKEKHRTYEYEKAAAMESRPPPDF